MNNRLSPFYKNIALWLLITLVMIFLFNYFYSVENTRGKTTLSYSKFLELVKADKVSRVTLQGDEISGVFTDNKPFKSYAPSDPDLVKLLQSKKVEITAKPKEDSPWYTTLLLSWLPMLVLVGIWIFFMRQMQAGGGKAMSFGKSRARLLTENTVKVTLTELSVIRRARLLPKDMALPPPDCIWRMKKIQMPTRTSMGSQETSKVVYQGLSSFGLAVISTPLRCRSLTRSGSWGA